MAIKERIIEVMTYIIVSAAFLIMSPALGKYLDFIFLKINFIFSPHLIILIPGVLISITGLFLVFWTIFLFKKFGKGTPNPSIPPKALVIKGPYKIVRNPMALGGAILLTGEILIYYSLSLLLLTILYVIILYLNAVFIEEPELKKRFGQPYEEYLKEVPRFFPSILRMIKN
jgi:protein-S-isoprenylcysteine O-methyltransferase Ste14